MAQKLSQNQMSELKETRLDYYYVAAILSNLFLYISIWIILFPFLF